MKKITLITLILSNIAVNAQITLEQTYDSASNFSYDQLLMVNLEVSGEKYVRINRTAETINFYNLNHTFYKSISYASFPNYAPPDATIIYISELLFDLDNEIEFMYVTTDGLSFYTGIYNEDGALLFSADSAAPLIKLNTHQQQYPIYNTTQGTKMILSFLYGGKAKVYSLPGTLSTAIEDFNTQYIQSNFSEMRLFPNPTGDEFIISGNFSMPAVLEMYDVMGRKVREFTVNGSRFTVDVQGWSKGVYLYRLMDSGGAVVSGKVVVE